MHSVYKNGSRSPPGSGAGGFPPRFALRRPLSHDVRPHTQDAAKLKRSATPGASTSRSRRAVRIVALVEALKGVIVLVAATGLLAFVHKDLNDLAARLVEHSHLNPASKYPHIFLDAVSHLQRPRLVWLAAGASAYASVRLIEAYGLFWERAWAECLAAFSGGLYVPLELIELVREPSKLGVAVLAVNVAVVAVMVWALVQRRRSHADSAV